MKPLGDLRKQLTRNQKYYEFFINQLRQLSARSPLEKLPPAYNYGYYRPNPFSSLLGPEPPFKNGSIGSKLVDGIGSSCSSNVNGQFSSDPDPKAFKTSRFIWKRKTLDSTFLTMNNANSSSISEKHLWDESDPATTFPLSKLPVINDVPLPKCIVRHLQHPHPLLLAPTSKLSPITSLALNAAASAGETESKTQKSDSAVVTLPTKIRGFRVDVRGRKGPRSLVQVIKYGKLGLKKFSTDYVDFGKSFYLHKLGITGVKAWISFEK